MVCAFILYSTITIISSCLTMCNFPEFMDCSLAPLDAPAFSHVRAHTLACVRAHTHTFHQWLLWSSCCRRVLDYQLLLLRRCEEELRQVRWSKVQGLILVQDQDSTAYQFGKQRCFWQMKMPIWSDALRNGTNEWHFIAVPMYGHGFCSYLRNRIWPEIWNYTNVIQD